MQVGLSPDAVALVLGVFLSGHPIVALDPHLPAERVSTILAELEKHDRRAESMIADAEHLDAARTVAAAHSLPVTDLAAIEVVVGLPRSLDGSEGPAAAKAREWATHLRSALQDAPIDNTPVRLVDERLTTVDAHRGLRDSGVAGRRHRDVVDQAAAVLILQTALDTERATGRPPGERVGRPRRRTPRKGKKA